MDYKLTDDGIETTSKSYETEERLLMKKQILEDRLDVIKAKLALFK